MGGAKRVSDAFAQTFVYESLPIKITRYYRDGQVTVSTGSTGDMLKDKCNRSNKTSNPALTFRGIPNFRKPSDYGTYAINIKRSPGLKVKTDKPSRWSNNVIREEQEFHVVGYNETDYLAGFPVIRWASSSVGSAGNALRRARTSALNEIGDMKAEIGVALAEAKRSHGMLVNATLSAVRALRALRRGNFRVAAKELGVSDTKRLGNRYLEYTYGWAPLIQTAYDSLNLMEAALKQPLLVKGSSSDGTSVEVTSKPSICTSASSEFRCKVGLIAKLDDYYLRTCQQAGLVNPASLGWELIPFSFVFDWFVPVGDLLSALTATSGLSFVSGYENFSNEQRASYEGFATSYWEKTTPATAELVHSAFQRRKLEGFPRPMLHTSKSPFSTRRALNAIALLRQRL